MGVRALGSSTPAPTEAVAALTAALDAFVGLTVPAPTGVSATDTANIQAVLDSVPAEGAKVVFQAGTYAVNAGGLTCNKPVHLTGAGHGTWEAGGTRITCSSSTATLLALSGAGWAITDMAFVNTSGSRPTAGAGISASDADWVRMNRIQVSGFWNNIEVSAGYYYTLSDSMILNPVNYGVWLRNTAVAQFDHGDHGIVNCVITKYGDTVAGGTAVRWESGGGLRFVANKINGGTQPGYTSTAKFAYGIDLAIADGNTVDLMVSGCSLENCTTAAIKVSAQNTGTFRGISVVGNEIGYCGNGIQMWGTGTQIGSAVIDGNVFTSIGANAIHALYMNGLTIGANHHYNQSATQPCINLGAGNTNIAVAPQTFESDVYMLLDDNVITYQSDTYGKALIKHEYEREVVSTSTTTYTTLYRFSFSRYAAGEIELSIHGNASGVGGYHLKARRAFTTDASRNITLTTIGTDVSVYASGAVQPADVSFDIAAVTGEIQVKVRANGSSSATALYGRATVRVDGLVYQARRGA